MTDTRWNVRRWLTWRRLGAIALMVPLVAVVAPMAWFGPRDVAGLAGSAIALLIGSAMAALLVAVIRRRDDLETAGERRDAFLRDHVPAPDDVVCLFHDSLATDLSSVFVDRAADRIVFERCHTPRGWLVPGNDRRYACAIDDVEGIMLPRRLPGDPGTTNRGDPSRDRSAAVPLVVLTPRGRATIPADADGVSALVAFLESRVRVVPHPAVDRPETMVAMVGGAVAGMAAGAATASVLVPGLSDAAFAWSFLGGAVAGALGTRAMLGIVDRWFGVDLAGPLGGAVKGAAIAMHAVVPLWFIGGPWLPAATIALAATIGAIVARRPWQASTQAPSPTPDAFRARVQACPGVAADEEASARLRECLVGQWRRRRKDPAAYVGDLLHALVHDAHAAGRGGAWRPDVEVTDGEVRVCCDWTGVASGKPSAAKDPDPVAQTRALLRAIADLASMLAASEDPPYRLVVEFVPSKGLAALVGAACPDRDTLRRVGVDDDGRFVVRIRELAPSPGALPLPPLADLLRPEARSETGSDDADARTLEDETTS